MAAQNDLEVPGNTSLCPSTSNAKSLLFATNILMFVSFPWIIASKRKAVWIGLPICQIWLLWLFLSVCVAGEGVLKNEAYRQKMQIVYELKQYISVVCQSISVVTLILLFCELSSQTVAANAAYIKNIVIQFFKTSLQHVHIYIFINFPTHLFATSLLNLKFYVIENLRAAQVKYIKRCISTYFRFLLLNSKKSSVIFETQCK